MLSYPDGLPTGEAVITTGGNLPAKYVIHTVGPVYGRGGQDKPKCWPACYRNSLALAVVRGAYDDRLSCDLAGVYGYPQTKRQTWLRAQSSNF